MKITVKQLKKLIREQVEEMSAGMPEKRRRAGLPPIRIYAKKKDDGTITFHIESRGETFSLTDEEGILDWINNRLAQMKSQLS